LQRNDILTPPPPLEDSHYATEAEEHEIVGVSDPSMSGIHQQRQILEILESNVSKKKLAFTASGHQPISEYPTMRDIGTQDRLNNVVNSEF
jgi:hypothetical protein